MKKKKTQSGSGRKGPRSVKRQTSGGDHEQPKSQPLGFLQKFKFQYPRLYEVMYCRVDSPRYLKFEADLEQKQREHRSRRK
jgi:hypothetical protein